MRNALHKFSMLMTILLAVCCSMSCQSSKATAVLKPENAPVTDTLAEFKANPGSYRNWKLVNPQPTELRRMPGGPPPGVLCADPISSRDDPHAGKFISVYVNAIGERAMLGEKSPRFPVGSIIVKEKRQGRADSSPVLLTAMVKREGGYNPKIGDWEFLVMDGEAARVSAPAKVESCQACHTFYQARDYVTRTYLPKEVMDQLK